jgi:amino acid transporter
MASTPSASPQQEGPSPHESRTGLLADSVSPLATLFQSITFMAPGAAIVFSLSIAVPLAGNALPVAVLIAGAACLLAAVALGQLASEIPSAGGLYSYAAVGLGPKSGFMMGWLYVGAAAFFPPFLLVLFGWFIETTLDAEGVPSPPWWVWSLISVVVVFFLTYFGVRLSTRAGVILGTIEIVVFVALAATMIFSKPNSLSAFNPGSAPSIGALFQGAIYGVLAFTGFEVASTMGEEAKNPRRTVQYSIVLSALIVGALYLFCTYGWVVGSDFKIVAHLEKSGGNAWDAFGHEFWGAGWVLVFLALVNSIIANAVASVNNAGRVLFAMGQVGAAPSYLGAVHPQHRTPHTAIVTVLGLSTVVTLLAGWKFGAGVAWGVLATIFTILAILIYMISCVACISYFSRKGGRPRFNPFLHAIIPAGGVLVFVLPLYAQYFDLGGLFEGKLFTSIVAYPFSWADWGAIIWVVIGIGLILVLARRKPEALTNAGRAFSGATKEDPWSRI